MTNQETTALSCQYDIITSSNVKINKISNINKQLSIHYLIYRIENIQNGKYYIGQHQTKNPLDSYMGSGKIIKRAIKCEGVQNFIKTILYDFATFEQMNEKEKELVKFDNCFPQNPYSYNIIEGGARQCARKGFANGMYGRSVKDCMTEEQIKQWHRHVTDRNREIASRPDRHQKMSAVTAGEKNPMYGHKCTEFMTESEIMKWRENLSKAAKGKNNSMYGKNSWANFTGEKAEDRKRRFKKSMAGKNKGKRMMQLPGTNIVKFVPKDDIQTYLANGYLFSDAKGRIRKQIAEMPAINN